MCIRDRPNPGQIDDDDDKKFLSKIFVGYFFYYNTDTCYCPDDPRTCGNYIGYTTRCSSISVLPQSHSGKHILRFISLWWTVGQAMRRRDAAAACVNIISLMSVCLFACLSVD